MKVQSYDLSSYNHFGDTTEAETWFSKYVQHTYKSY